MASVLSDNSIAVLNALRKIHSFKEFDVHDPRAPRRSSVAIILRFPELNLDSNSISLESFLTRLSDVSTATIDPEILFIKRASSERDRWSSHIALPGGRCEEGETDLEAAIRESYEEVGLDLTKDGLYVGPLDQRLLSVSWGTKPIMTLCPFVFILTKPHARVEIQPTEVATAFWHPFSQLINPHRKSYELVNVSARLNLDQYKFLPHFTHSWINANVGKMKFAAVDLFTDKDELLHSEPNTDLADPPYKLWGVTYSVMVDFMAVVTSAPHTQPLKAKDIKLPTLKNWDMQFISWIIGFWHVRSKRYFIDRILKTSGCVPGSMDLVNKMLDGYFFYPRLAILGGVILRTLVAIYLTVKFTQRVLSRIR